MLSLEIRSKWLKMKWNIMKTFCLGLFYCEMDKTSPISHWSSRLKKEKNNNCRNVAFIQHEKIFLSLIMQRPNLSRGQKNHSSNMVSPLKIAFVDSRFQPALNWNRFFGGFKTQLKFMKFGHWIHFHKLQSRDSVFGICI